MKSQGIRRSEAGHCAYYKMFGDGSFIILLLYADDMLVAPPGMNKIIDLKA